MRKTDREIQDKIGAVKICNVSEIVRNRSIIARTPYHFENGQGFYLHKGKQIEESDFLKMFPTTGKPFAIKGKNYDRTKNWMHDEKSF
jgi:hypothetical protein